MCPSPAAFAEPFGDGGNPLVLLEVTSDPSEEYVTLSPIPCVEAASRSPLLVLRGDA